jgi:hypothetical protein
MPPIGHDDVHRHEVRRLLILFDRLEARFPLHDLESRLRRDVADHGAHEDRVVTDKNDYWLVTPP